MATNASRVFALSKVFHERARLGIMTVLVTRGEDVEFGELLGLLGLTKGNLAVHAAKLEEAGYLEVRKGFVGKVPRTTYRATPLGRQDFAAYLEVLEEVIAHAKGGAGGSA